METSVLAILVHELERPGRITFLVQNWSFCLLMLLFVLFCFVLFANAKPFLFSKGHRKAVEECGPPSASNSWGKGLPEVRQANSKLLLIWALGLGRWRWIETSSNKAHTQSSRLKKKKQVLKRCPQDLCKIFCGCGLEGVYVHGLLDLPLGLEFINLTRLTGHQVPWLLSPPPYSGITGTIHHTSGF